MKIRNGFVSNSSSSSFIVDAKTTMEVFKKIIALVEKEYRSDYSDDDIWKQYHEGNVKRFVSSHDDSFNEGIIIPFTCNFDTYIFPAKNGKCYVESCNNHPWEEIFPDMVYEDNHCRHYDDDTTLFVNTSTNKTISAKAYSHKMFGGN